ncbi:MAG: family 10 glycosylhydrolase [Pseudomonadota bacterium]
MNLIPLARHGLAIASLAMCFTAAAAEREVRGTWLTTTGNSALGTPADTAASMRRLKEIGMNTVYVETWKNGYTQFPSDVLERTIGLRQRPVPQPQDPSDSPAQRQAPARDLLQESLIEAHRNGMVYVAWFEYGFMAAYKDTMNDLRKQKPAWLSRDKQGGEVAPNGFVWLNPLHPEARQFLLDMVLESVDKYDVDGIQLDDRIVWPHITMGYDDYTQQVYAAEHGGRRPPQDHLDPEWMRWRADKVNEFSKMFVQEIRARRPGLLISLSPAVHPWAWEHYLLEWPVWSAWGARDRLQSAPSSASFKHAASATTTPRWDEFIPQAYRFSYADFEKTWTGQVEAMRTLGGNRQRDLIAGIRIVGDGTDSSWEQLRGSIELTRKLGNGGHVLWYSRGVLDLYAQQLTAFYKASGPAASPRFGPGWRMPSLPLARASGTRGQNQWRVPKLGAGLYRAIGHDGARWEYLDVVLRSGRQLVLPQRYVKVELLRDRRPDMGVVPKQDN